MPVVLNLASVLPDDHPSSSALVYFRDELDKATGGHLQVRIFNNSQLGNATEAIENATNGSIPLAFASAAPLSQFVPQANVLSMPFVFGDVTHLHAVLDGPIGRELDRCIGKSGLKVLCYFDAGTRNIMTRKGPLRTPEDLRGLKIRVMSSKLMVDTLNALGASAVPMDQGEVYSALQLGVLDGWENNAPTALTFRMYETGCVYWARTAHLAIADLLLINTQTYERLTDEDRKALADVAARTQAMQRRLWAENEQQAMDKLRAAGVQFNDVDHGAFAGRVEAIYAQSSEKFGPEFASLLKRIRAGEEQ
jgi:tripartite ATP-independent transporter DctP family solute receptor